MFAIPNHMDYCPICYAGLEVRECAPCHDCGWNVPTELEHLGAGIHTYATYEIYKGLRLTLCNFCLVDFGSYHPEYFGFKTEQRLYFDSFHFIRDIHYPQPELDKFCPTCSSRLRFLKVLQAIRELNSSHENPDP